MKFLFLFFPAAVLSFGSNCPLALNESLAQSTSTAPRQDAIFGKKSVKIAVLGDQGLGSNAQSVLRMVKKWDAELLLHVGDFDYQDSPLAFMHLNTDVLGRKFPILAVPGNHDILNWFSPRFGYRDLLLRQAQRSGLRRHCSGDYGINSYCVLGDMVVVQSGVGTLGADHAEFIDKILSRYEDIPWKLCIWHKNQRNFQTGDEQDETGYLVYDVCRKHGAIIFTGHEHSYERTHLLSSFEAQTIVSNSSTLHVSPGYSFASVVGLGGKDIRVWKNDLQLNPWWAATGAADNGINYGALLCTFHFKGTPLAAECAFQDIDGVEWDRFRIELSPPDKEQHLVSVAPRSKLLEVPVAMPGIKSFYHHAAIPVKSPLKLSEGYMHELTFDIPHQGQFSPRQLYLQAMLHVSPAFNGEGQLKITVRQPELLSMGNEAECAADFVETISEAEQGEVWVSSDLLHLLSGLRPGPVTVSISGIQNTHDLAFYGIDEYLQTCTSPTLAVVTTQD
ncbi:hypothetical protein HDU91_003013 [Kappamyces sp. JEL0680]|nr:hypothetical protein HDU91_003013 [Kappamyces sp. JEL0680]